MGLNIIHSKLSEVANKSYLFLHYDYFRLKKIIDKDINILTKKVNEYFEIISGFAFSSKDYTDDGIKLIRISNISKYDELLYDKMSMLPQEYKKKYKNYLLKNNDIVIGMTGDGKLFKTGIVENISNDVLLNQRVGILRLKENIKYNQKFFYYLTKLDLFQNQIKIVAMGKTQKNVSPFDLLKIQIPNISLDIQNKAIKQIEPLENDIHNLKSQKKEHLEIINDVFSEELKFDWDKFNKIKKEKVFISSLFQFSQNKDLRCGYKFHNKANQFLHNFLLSKTNKKVKDFIDEPIVLGKSISPSLYDEDGEYYYIAMSNIKNYRFDTKDCKKVGVNYFTDNKNKSIQQNDILLARSGEGTIGKVAIIEDDEIEGIFADFTMRIRLTNYNQLFAYYYFRSDFFQYLVYTHKKGLGNNTNIFPNQLQEFPLLDFTLEHQQQLVDKIKTKIDSQEDIDERIKNKQDEISLIIEDAIEGEKI